jgi:hypothetical protein
VAQPSALPAGAQDKTARRARLISDRPRSVTYKRTRTNARVPTNTFKDNFK